METAAAPDVNVRTYNLPDAALLQPSALPGRCTVFVPPALLVVIGKGSDPAREVNLDAARHDAVPVLRRGSGGCAVVLSPEMLVAAVAVYGTQQRKSAEYFELFNGLIIEALAGNGIADLVHAGTSDIALNGRKIAGTALYRNRQVVFYHAIINLRGDPEIIERYLRLPPRMPGYRANRPHAEFVTSLAAAGFTVDVAAVSSALRTRFEQFIDDPLPEQRQTRE